MRRMGILAIALVASCNTQATGEMIGFEFGGMVLQSVGSPFGTIPLFSPVSGSFVYDTATPVTTIYNDPECVGGCAGYRQAIPGGFTATFGSVVVTADHYEIHIANDFQNVSGETDWITIRWSSALTPQLASPLVADGTNYSEGLFSVDLLSGPNLFSDTSLPTTLNLGDFDEGTSGVLMQDPAGPTINVWFMVDSLSAMDVPQAVTVVPEPEGFWLALSALVMLGLLYYWRKAIGFC